MIYTTYFARLKYLPENIIPISICGKAPAGYKGFQYKKLAPKYDFFMEWKRTGDNDYYIKCFNEFVLSCLDPAEVVNDLFDLVGKSDQSADIALVCYEHPKDFCHRHLVANWLTKCGYTCEEFIVDF